MPCTYRVREVVESFNQRNSAQAHARVCWFKWCIRTPSRLLLKASETWLERSKWTYSRIAHFLFESCWNGFTSASEAWTISTDTTAGPGKEISWPLHKAARIRDERWGFIHYGQIGLFTFGFSGIPIHQIATSIKQVVCGGIDVSSNNWAKIILLVHERPAFAKLIPLEPDAEG